MNLPTATDIEQSVLSALCWKPERIREVLAAGDDIINDPYNLLIFKAMEDLYEHGVPADQITLTEALRRHGSLAQVGGEETVAYLFGEAVTDANLGYHLAILREKAMGRKMIWAFRNGLDTAQRPDADYDTVLSEARAALAECGEYREGGRSLADRVREWVVSTDGVFLSSDVAKDLDLSSRVDRKNCSKILTRLCDDSVIERAGERRGRYRVVDADCEVVDWQSAPETTIDLRWPLALEEYVETLPGNIIVIAGEQNAGKTAFLLETVRMNMARHDIWYFTSEMGDAELRKRLRKFDIPLDQWRFNARSRAYNVHDVIRPDAVNIIDFLEIHDEFWKVGSMLKKVHDRLAGGVAIVAMQKNRDTLMGRGGAMGLEKPRLYLALSPGELTIVKGKHWARENVNPNGKVFNFRLVDGWRFAANDRCETESEKVGTAQSV